ncbi:glycerol kinase GlpK [Paenibacillus sp. OAS669]|uniref:glycerol kinase GlpK n=1 Tax=Paenibacillus sp. OAS669 TaxID=2663821 RepID=UPI00178B465A|nr:glycerol kinase GlpK [Paenibacillus sp. OAS669]MBE1440800.1 glycerol kinase [Paenibacillus sp. OAS669]
MDNYILAIDQSTSGTKALIVDREGCIAAVSTSQHTQYYPAPGWVEHDALEIYDQVLQCSADVLAKAGIGPERIVAVTITNQRETAVVWDKRTGMPISRAIVWQCQRTAAICERLTLEGHESIVKERTGLMLDPYFSATKWHWILKHTEGAQEKLAAGDLLAGTIDSWLLWKLTGGAAHATDYTNASRTSLFNIHTLQWDEDLCRLFGVPASLLPAVRPSDVVFGYTSGAGSLADGIPIAGLIGDSQAALFGNLCFEKGMAKATYGTGTSVLMNVGTAPAPASDGLVQAIAWGQGGSVMYALEAVIRTSGDSIKWIRDNLGLFQTFDEMEQLLAETPANDGVYLVPAFVGLGAPHWKPHARAAITGMNRGTGKGHMIRAALESIAYQVCDAVELLQTKSGMDLRELRADGGASNNSTLMQFQADMLGKRVRKSGIAELSALGSAYMGGLAVGYWASLEDIVRNRRDSRTYEPQMDQNERIRYYDGWKRAIASVISGTAVI